MDFSDIISNNDFTEEQEKKLKNQLKKNREQAEEHLDLMKYNIELTQNLIEKVREGEKVDIPGISGEMKKEKAISYLENRIEHFENFRDDLEETKRTVDEEL